MSATNSYGVILSVPEKKYFRDTGKGLTRSLKQAHLYTREQAMTLWGPSFKERRLKFIPQKRHHATNSPSRKDSNGL